MRKRTTSKRAVEAELTNQQIRDLLEPALRDEHEGDAAGSDYLWVWVRDWTSDWVVYEVDTGTKTDTYKRTYSIDASNKVTLGAAEEVVAQTTFVPSGEVVTESSVRVEGRVLEAKPDAADGGRVFRVQIVAYGDSKNRRRYTESVMRAAAPLYEGAKAYDHHRTDSEMRTSTVTGLVGSYRNVEATGTGVEADLCLLPSAVHVAEALAASVQATQDGLQPLVGISHDVAGRFRQTADGVLEAVSIDAVNSADVVADPAAGGVPMRAVAGGTEETPATTTTPEEQPVTLEELLKLIDGATDDEKTKVLAGLGIDEASLAKLAANDPAAAGAGDGGTTATTTATAEPEPVLAGAATEAKHAKESLLAGSLVDAAMKQRRLNPELRTLVVEGLADHFTEADLIRQVESVQKIAESFGKRGLMPSVPDVRVTGDERDKRLQRLDAMFDPNAREGYRSMKAAYRDVMGIDAGLDEIGADEIIRESWNGSFDSGRSQRVVESMTTASWGEILGDSITRRLVAEYGLPNLQTWKKIVSSIFPLTDFRTQRIGRFGGYGTLPTVAEAGPYTALTSPTDEEATYAPSKKGGTEDLTLEMIRNDDLRAIRRIPSKLGRAAAQTLYNAVWGILSANAAVSYDSVALFHASHANTDATAVLAQATLSAGRKKMRKQTAYNNSSEVLGAVAIPKYLIVPNDLEEIAFQLCTSAVAIPSTPAGPSNTPNIHQGLEPVVIDILSDTNDWFLGADPTQIPTVEVGFLDGKEDPELFVNDDPTQGAVFSNDKITYKIRHIWGYTVLDHRGFYRASN